MKVSELKTWSVVLKVLKKQNMLHCTDEDKNKTLFSAWEIRPYPED
jgi:hypothetical protein